MDKKMTLGSLFDGSGGFPLGGLLRGIEPLWASEVEPFPIRVTTKRLPQMKHLGDINKIDGSLIPPVDIITAGFCCQDLSVAGKRAGFHGERSGLFFQVIRIIREILAATNNTYPKFAVLENVPGIYSSAGGADFQEVLNELIQIKDETLSIPLPEKGGWSTSGEIVGDGFSVGWRTLDAQFWGVAQRRRRCFIVVDFTGERAGKILFDETRLRGNPPQSRFPWQTSAGGSAVGSGSAVVFEPGACSRLGGHVWNGAPVGTLRADMGDNQTAVVIENYPADSRVKLCEDGVFQTLSEHMGTGGCNVPLVMNERQYALTVGEDLANTLTGTDYKGTQCVFEPAGLPGGEEDKKSAEKLMTAFGICSYNSNSMISPNPRSGFYEAETARTLDTSVPDPNKNAGGMAIVALEGNGARPSHRGDGYGGDVSFTLNSVERHAVSYGIDRASFNQGKNAQYNPQFTEESAATLTSRGPSAVCSRYIVRRLTPTECALLQGFPPGWCAGLETSEPTEEDIAFWSDVWETHRNIIGTSSKPKTRNQIIKWLKSPHSDAAEYKMWGNGLVLNCVVFVLSGIRTHTLSA